MPALVIKDLPAVLHRRLKDDAVQHHRSMTQQAIFILEQALHRVRPIAEVTPYRGAFPLTNAFMNKAKKEGRP